MAVVNVTPAAHAAAKAAAERAGMSLGAWASETLSARATNWDDSLYALGHQLHQEIADRLFQMALERSQTPSETLSAALDALASPRGIQPPKPAPDRGCGCDGPEGDGPWHKPSCGRRT